MFGYTSAHYYLIEAEAL